MLPGFEDRVICSSLKERPVPDDVFCYARPDLWQPRLWAMLGDYLDDDVKAIFLEETPEYVVSDDLSWLDDIIDDVHGDRSDIKQLTADRLAEEFRAFRMFHATRTNDLASFYKGGLRFPSNAEIEERARVFFLNGSLPGATEKNLERAIEELNHGTFTYRSDENCRIYCCADERDFTTRSGRSGHYLDFGSEYLYNLGIRIVGSHRAQEALRSHGLPTLFMLDVPMHLVREPTLRAFAGYLLEYMFCDLAEGLEAHALSPGAGSSFSLTDEIPGSAFVGHYHPEKFYHNL